MPFYSEFLKNKTVALPPTVLANWGVLGFGPELSSTEMNCELWQSRTRADRSEVRAQSPEPVSLGSGTRQARRSCGEAK